MTELTQEQKITRYRDEVLPSMNIDDLLTELVRAEHANQNVDGHQYRMMDHQIGLIRAEIKKRVA